MAILTGNGETSQITCYEGIFYIGLPGGATETDYGGGTAVLQRLLPGGDPTEDDDWVTVSDSSSGSVELMSYTTGHQAMPFDVKGSTRVRGKLTGATNPSLRMDIVARTEV